VLLDFSSPSGMMSDWRWHGQRGLAFVSGTTGIAAEHQAALRTAALEIPVLWSASFSLGIALLKRLAMDAVRAVGPEFDVEIIEAHHRTRSTRPRARRWPSVGPWPRRAPSQFEQVARYGRERVGSKRRPDEIGFSSIRGATSWASTPS
jgi:4-hydroxy-tetrahydrodipicolinate reductase